MREFRSNFCEILENNLTMVMTRESEKKPLFRI